MGEVMDAFVDAGDLGIFLEVLQHVAIDDRRIDAAQVEQIVDVLERSPRHNRQNAHFGAVVDDARKLGGKP